MNRKRLLALFAACACVMIAVGGVAVTRAADQPDVKKSKNGRVMRITKLKPNATRLMPDLLGDRKIDHGGLYLFKPGETAHPEAKHSHDSEEVFIFVQGKGVIPIDGIEYPVKTGDVVIVKAGEDHHTRSSEDAPLVACWYVMEK